MMSESQTEPADELLDQTKMPLHVHRDAAFPRHFRKRRGPRDRR